MQIDIRLFTILGLSTAAVSCVNSNGPDAEKPNILYIMSDDHAYQAVSASGRSCANS